MRSDWRLYERRMGEKDTDAQGDCHGKTQRGKSPVRMEVAIGGRTVKSCQTPGAPRAWKRQGGILSSAFEGVQFCQHLALGLPVSRTVRQ